MHPWVISFFCEALSLPEPWRNCRIQHSRGVWISMLGEFQIPLQTEYQEARMKRGEKRCLVRFQPFFEFLWYPRLPDKWRFVTLETRKKTVAGWDLFGLGRYFEHLPGGAEGPRYSGWNMLELKLPQSNDGLFKSIIFGVYILLWAGIRSFYMLLWAGIRNYVPLHFENLVSTSNVFIKAIPFLPLNPLRLLVHTWEVDVLPLVTRRTLKADHIGMGWGLSFPWSSPWGTGLTVSVEASRWSHHGKPGVWGVISWNGLRPAGMQLNGTNAQKEWQAPASGPLGGGLGAGNEFF